MSVLGISKACINYNVKLDRIKSLVDVVRSQ
jgi:hypothetical protein